MACGECVLRGRRLVLPGSAEAAIRRPKKRSWLLKNWSSFDDEERMNRRRRTLEAIVLS
jgi:hypothetical protein